MATTVATTVFEEHESNVRSYCRSYPAIFNKAKGSLLYSEAGDEYIDFFAGAGALNYGHNNDYINQKLIDYIASDCVMHGLDMHTVAKRDFIENFSELLLKPKGLEYKLQFCGPTGTNAVEAAFKLARKVTKRTNIFSFMGGYHGMSLGSLAATGNTSSRAGAGVPLNNVTFMPYPQGFMATFDTIQYIETVLDDVCSGIEKPAAIIFETIQAEGGINVAPVEWMKALRQLCDRHEILLICDEIQTGCCRTGPFFSFERAGIVPDMIVLSKSIGGSGAPMALLLLKADLDVWSPGEHTGTFRGNQLAFIGASAALELVRDTGLEQEVERKGAFLEKLLHDEIGTLSDKIEIRGVGLMQGIDLGKLAPPNVVQQVKNYCFEHGLIVEMVGRDDVVVKLLPALTIDDDLLAQGCTIIKDAIQSVLGSYL